MNHWYTWMLAVHKPLSPEPSNNAPLPPIDKPNNIQKGMRSKFSSHSLRHNIEKVCAMPSNKALFLTGVGGRFEAKSAPYPRPEPNQVVVKNTAIAVNPIDWVVQQAGNVAAAHVKYPWVGGSDVAGEVVEIGGNVTRFKAGDRVVGHALGFDKVLGNKSSAHGAFQAYTVLLEHMTTLIPASTSFATACVIPLGVSTAACGLYSKDQLDLQPPSTPPRKSTGKTVLIWGGATSVGCNAIQLAVASGYEVVTTCSAKNNALVKRLGATQAFDYRSSRVVSEVTNALKSKDLVGALSIGPGSADQCVAVLKGCEKARRFVSMVTFPLPDPLPERFATLRLYFAFISWGLSHWLTCRSNGIKTNFVVATTVAQNEVGRQIYQDFLPQALEDGIFVPAPDPQNAGSGLEAIKEGLKIQKKGVSAAKVVVTL